MWYGLLAALAAIAALMLALWLLSLRLKDASIVDAAWGPGFGLATAAALLANAAFTPRALLLLALVLLWGGRLGLYIFRRNHGQPEDYRYQAMRRKHGARFPLVSLLSVFGLQGALMAIIAAPLLLTVLTDAPAWLGPIELAATALFALGFACEAIADAQLRRFKADPANKGRVMQTGLWRLSRHPNYFGEALLWWGLYLYACGAPWGFTTIFSPLLMTFLLTRVSGVPLLEKKLKTNPEYRDYVERTSAFILWPPRRKP